MRRLGSPSAQHVVDAERDYDVASRAAGLASRATDKGDCEAAYDHFSRAVQNRGAAIAHAASADAEGRASLARADHLALHNVRAARGAFLKRCVVKR